MQMVQFKIDGMSCEGCAKSVTAALQGSPGVETVAVNFATSIADIGFDDSLTNVETLKAAVEAAGFDVV
ncbi:heavy-metal-associated domain-containing protein [Snodgrassella sp. ESL0253]|uniref:heavy-metal-associated domain-containing protein n=1 Tax=Snodgrassella sp. ESL0253 TaxID=2705031 RepID=UPI0015831EDD|nr:heavy-metal-associated domain-containing protein [Snodgrassella sp. ESL0253]NUE67338.1 heavy-metal-associated domain-containing protein [Snodgrassella sp. ESL0253]